VVTNPFVGRSIAARYVVARPELHAAAIDLLGVRSVGRALDVGCGTGMSTRALARIAGMTVGVDVSADMLDESSGGSGIRFVRARAERLPFDDDTFALATIASAVHWFEDQGWREVQRVLAPGGELLVYDVYFRATMADEPGFEEWTSTNLGERYGAVPKQPRPASADVGFESVWTRDLPIDVEMGHSQLVELLMSHSERIAAVREGSESEDEQRSFLSQGTERFFSDGSVRTLGFGIRAELFLALQPASL
jgi:ubiquinone/menaquinone biosynthesis C-methylase UbiE